MSNLWNEVPEAEIFYEDVVKNLNNFLLFEKESFSRINQAILGTSNIDSQNEAFDISSLQGVVSYVKEKPMWLNVEHNPLFPPHGRIIAAKVFYAPESEIYFLAGVIGRYSEENFRKFKDFNIDFSKLEDSLPELDFLLIGDDVEISYNPHEIESKMIEDILTDSPNIVSKKVKRSIRKEADPITILTFFVSIFVLTNNPFSKKFLEKYGEKSAEASISFFTWLQKKVFKKFSEIYSERVLFEFISPYKNCTAKFVIASKDVAILCEASDTIYKASRSAVKLIDYLEETQPETLVYQFNLEAKRWVPLYISTQKEGVITDQPYLIAIDQITGLSLGGIQ